MTIKIHTTIILTALITLVFTGLFTREKYLYMNGRRNFEKFLQEHPYALREKLTDKQWKKKLPKKDRPDLAMEQNFLMTMDPATRTIPRDRLLLAYEAADRYREHSFRDMVWTEHGPDNVGGRTRAVMFDPNDEYGTKVWTGGVSGGLWYTADITENTPVWHNVAGFWDNLAVSCIAYDPGNTNIFYVGTGEGWFNADAVGGGGIWKTVDGGTTWDHLANTNTNDFYYIQKIAVEGATGHVYAATSGYYSNSDGGIYRSNDGGNSWSLVLESTNSYASRGADIEIAGDGYLYSSMGIYYTDGLYKSSDGVAWIKLNTGSNGFPDGANNEFERLEIAVSQSNPAVIYVVGSKTTEDDNDVGIFLKTTNSGTTWSNVTIPQDPNGVQFTRGQAWYDLILSVDPTDENIVYAGGIDLYKSTDGGQTWNEISHWYGGFGYPYVHADQHSISFQPGDNQTILFGNDGGLHFSDDGGVSFEHRNFGYNVTQFYSCALHPDLGENYFLAGAQDNGTQQFINATGTVNTNEVTGGDGAYCFIDQSDPEIQITSYVYNNYYLSTNGGNSFQSITNDNSGRFINPSDYDDASDILYSAKDENYIKRTTGFTGTITEDYINIDLGSIASHIRVSQYSDNTVFVGTGGGRLFKIQSAHGDNPQSSELTSNDFPYGYISCIEFGESENQILITFSNYGVASIWETLNGGSTWSNKEGNLPDMPIRWVLYNPNNYHEAVLATEVGVWKTVNLNSATPAWTSSNSELGNVRTDMLMIRSVDNFVIAATHGRGLFSSSGFQFLPAATISANSITATVPPGIVNTEQIAITNSGEEGSTLEYSISLEYPSPNLAPAIPENTDNRFETYLNAVTDRIDSPAGGIENNREEVIISYHGEPEYSWDTPDNNNIPEWGVRFTPTENISLLEGANFFWYSAYGTPDITVLVYADNGNGFPGNDLGSVSVPWQNIVPQSWNYIDLTSLNLSIGAGEDFFITFSVDDGIFETWGLKIVSDQGDQTIDRSYGYFSNSWSRIGNLFGTSYEWCIQAKVNYDENPALSWLSVNPNSGTLSQNESDSIFIVMDATELLDEAIYTASVIINHNGGTPDTVAVTMNVSSTAGIEEQIVSIPERVNLYQNFPNPFNPSTIIRYELPKDSQVKLDIFDVKGRYIRSLSDNAEAAGTHNVQWDSRDSQGRKVPNGVYFYTITTNDFTQTNKMVFIK